MTNQAGEPLNRTGPTRTLDLKEFVLGAPLVVALVARLLGIASRPIWYDEAFAVLFSEKGPAAMVRGTLAVTGSAAADVHPIGYYTLLWLWMRAFGQSLIAVRLLSIVGGLGAVALVVLLARELFGPRTALAAGMIAALAPFQIHYAQEIRMYSWLACWLLLATYCYLRGSRSGAWGWWIGFGVSAALGQYTQNLAAFYLIALALWPVIRRDWRTARWVAAGGALALLLYLPWLVHLPAQFAKVGQSYWVGRPAPYRLLTLVLFFIPHLPLPGIQLAAGLLLALFVVAIAALQTVKAIRSRQPGAQHAAWVVYLSFVPAVLLFLFSQWKPVYLERALLPSGAAFCVWLGWAFRETRLPRFMSGVVILALAIAFGLGLYNHLAYAGFPYAPYASLDAALASNLRPGDAIVHSSKLSMLPAAYFDRTLQQSYLADVAGSPEDTLASATQEVLGLPAQPDLPGAVGDAQRVWFIVFDESIREYADAGYPKHPQLSWLEEHFPTMQEQNWGPLRVYLFSQGE